MRHITLLTKTRVPGKADEKLREVNLFCGPLKEILGKCGEPAS